MFNCELTIVESFKHCRKCLQLVQMQSEKGVQHWFTHLHNFEMGTRKNKRIRDIMFFNMKTHIFKTLNDQLAINELVYI